MINESFKKALNKASEAMGSDPVATIEKYETAMNNAKERRVNAATDIMNTGNTGFGAETAVAVSYTDELYSLIAQYPGLMAYLPANHGQKQGSTVTVDVIGEADLFKTATEPTGSQSFISITTNDAVATGKTDITVKSFRKILGITRKDMHDAIRGGNDFYSTIQNKILLALARTLEAYIINADATTAETNEAAANVNFYDTDASVTMPTDAYWLGGNSGIRKEAIANTIVGGAVAFSRGQILNTMNVVSDYLDDFDRMLWIQSGKAAVKSRGLAEYSTVDVFGRPTNTEGGKITKLEGINTYIAKHMPSAVGVSGKVEVGGATSNIYQTMSLVHTYAPQYCFGEDMTFVVHEDSQRIIFDVSAWFGCAIADEKAGLGKTVAQLVYTA